MAVGFRASSKASNNPSTSVTITKPAGVVSGDLMIAVITNATDETITPPSGWTEYSDSPRLPSAFNKAWAYRKVAGGSEPANYTWSFTGGGARNGGAISAYTDAEYKDHAGANDSADDTPPAPTVNAAAGSWSVCMATSNSFNADIAEPASQTERELVTGGPSDIAELCDSNGTVSGTPYAPGDWTWASTGRS